MDRITQADLDQAVRVLNVAAGFEPDAKAWNRSPEGRNVATVGMYVLNGAYGGWQLQRIATTGGGITAITSGHRPRREVYGLIRAYTDGLRAGGAR